jgi:hypothetical protein
VACSTWIDFATLNSSFCIILLPGHAAAGCAACGISRSRPGIALHRTSVQDGRRRLPNRYMRWRYSRMCGGGSTPRDRVGVDSAVSGQLGCDLHHDPGRAGRPAHFCHQRHRCDTQSVAAVAHCRHQMTWLGRLAQNTDGSVAGRSPAQAALSRAQAALSRAVMARRGSSCRTVVPQVCPAAPRSMDDCDSSRLVASARHTASECQAAIAAVDRGVDLGPRDVSHQ